MPCVAEIEGGATQARSELLFLIELEVLANIPRSLGFTNIYPCPALGADSFIEINQASERLVKSIAALRSLVIMLPLANPYPLYLALRKLLARQRKNRAA
jgi:hypothetical protein